MEYSKRLQKFERELKKACKELDSIGFDCDFEDVLSNLKAEEEAILDATVEDITFAVKLGKVIGYKQCMKDANLLLQDLKEKK